MMTIFGISGISLYFFLIKSLNQQLNQELLTLVEAAAPSLSVVKSEGKQSLEREISWRHLFSKQQFSLEWYDSSGKLLAREGNISTPSPLFTNISPAELRPGTPVFYRQGRIQTATISVYTNDREQEKLVLEGYIRASESTREIEAILGQLRLGLELGGATALILASISSVYLTTETVKPMKRGVQRLRRITTDVSHQVRTPLTRISIATEILLSQTSKTQTSQAKKLNIINSATEQIKRLLEELLFLVRTDIAFSTKELNFTYVPLMRILESLSEQFEPIARAKDINFQTQLSGNILIKADRDKLNRLLTNLLENAINYTDAGGSVFFSAKQSQNKVIITVEDTGIGISKEQLPLIFQDFWRSDAAKIKDPEGFGLGLVIADAIVQQHRGKITVNSKVGAGSRFQVHLPLS
ncbi:MAG: HAMP domain-containing sensor histidine kinase [Pleurocapsa sp. MO_226.B13]|nr:HAMP domain-containing sensor histidine kinase [Pleurocapsa sp. MO_226.B13]